MEAIRLVIWDLDETFWHGTLTEGGMRWRTEAEHAVSTLAQRGIISAICSKNDPADVDAVLAQHGMRPFFVFDSISWEPKGPRLAALITAIQLRPQSVLFIDDNPLNRAEAAHFAPGVQLADETIVPVLLDDERCRGKADPEMTRLAQYKLLERRQTDGARAGGDTAAFLRASNITVRIEHDLEPHIDRAVELINRTNQLNFTKQRLPEDPEEARTALRTLLSGHTIQAGLVHVRDNYGDYGFCGIYILRTQRGGFRFLLHFAFSCRILGIGLETWLWGRLERPALEVAGPVLTDIANDKREIDWIGMEAAEARTAASGDAPSRLAYVLARGGCDMRAVAHYFGMAADRVIEEFDTIRLGQTPLVNHSLIAVQAMDGIDARVIADFAPLGFLVEDFSTMLAGEPPPGPAVWLMSFAIEVGAPIFRHRETGARLPAYPAGIAKRHIRQMMRGEPAPGTCDPAVADHLRARFEYEGDLPEDVFLDNLRRIFSRAGNGVRVFVLLANVHVIDADGKPAVLQGLARQNALIAEAAAGFGNVELLTPADFMATEQVGTLASAHHFDRMTYFRIYQHIMARCAAAAKE